MLGKSEETETLCDVKENGNMKLNVHYWHIALWHLHIGTQQGIYFWYVLLAAVSNETLMSRKPRQNKYQSIIVIKSGQKATSETREMLATEKDWKLIVGMCIIVTTLRPDHLAENLLTVPWKKQVEEARERK